MSKEIEKQIDDLLDEQAEDLGISVERSPGGSPAVSISVGGRREVIEVGPRRIEYGTMREPKVSWSSLGRVTIDFAQVFADALQQAVDMAKKL